MVNLLDLSNEILWQIFSHLGMREYASLARVHSSLHAFLTSNPLAYHFECQVAGVIDNPHCGLDLRKRSAILECIEKGWSRLEFGFRTVTDAGSRLTVYPSLLCVKDGIVGGFDQDTSTLHYFKIPATDTEPIKWCNTHVEMEGKARAFDLSIYDDDLLAIATSRRIFQSSNTLHLLELRFLQFSSGRPHPGALIFKLTVGESEDDFLTCYITLAGDYVLVYTSENGIKIINWRRSIMCMKIPTCRIQAEPIFLSTHLLLVPNNERRTNPSLDIYSIPNPLPMAYQAGAGDSIHNPLFRLSFPCLEHRDFDLTSYAGTRPFRSRPTYSFKTCHTSLDNAVFCIIVDSYVNDGEADYDEPAYEFLFMIVQWSSLLELCTKFSQQQRQNMRMTGSTLSWDEWGPLTARWVRLPGNYTQDSVDVRVAGQRCVILRKESETWTSMTILDFNSVRVKKLQALQHYDHGAGDEESESGSAPKWDDEEIGEPEVDGENYIPVFHGPQTLPKSGLFAEEVKSHLLYSSITRRFKLSWDDFHVSEDALVVLGPQKDSDRIVEIFRFGASDEDEVLVFS